MLTRQFLLSVLWFNFGQCDKIFSNYPGPVTLVFGGNRRTRRAESKTFLEAVDLKETQLEKVDLIFNAKVKLISGNCSGNCT